MVTSQIEEIKNRLDIVELIGSYIKLNKTGINYRALCPFHSEKKPSFFVSPTRQMFKCFGCGISGDIFAFVKEIEGIEFGDALRILAQKAGVELKRVSPELKTKRQRLYEICELACCFFEKQLEDSLAGEEAKKYLLRRGINEESIKKWRLGYAPNNWRGLLNFLMSRGYNRKEIVSAGLAVESEKGTSLYDRFRARIIFPIFDLNSQVIGFGGRVKEGENEEVAKYINIPHTLLYDKSRVLYGLNFAKIPIRKKNQSILVEGYTDVIISHQSGFENTVAVAGTALTSQHLNILKRYSENLLLAFDMDIAGDSATKRGIDLAQEKGFEIKVANLPKNSDPADVIIQDFKKWEKIVNCSRSIFDFYFDSAFSNFNKETPEGKKEIAKIILPILKKIPNKIVMSHWVGELAKRLNVSQEDIFEELKKVKPSTEFDKENYSFRISYPRTIEGRKQILEEKIISLILNNPEFIQLIEKPQLSYFSKISQQILKAFKYPKEQKPLQVVLANLEKGAKEELKSFLATVSLRAETELEEKPEKEFKICLAELKSLEIKNQLNKIRENLKRAEKEKDQKQVNFLLKRFNQLIQEI